MLIEEVLQRDEQFRYMLLDRMKTDCHYYLQSSGHPKCLWANNEYKQIAYMKAIWNSFPEDGKPEWLTMQQIEQLEREMTPWLGDSPKEKIEAIEPHYAGDLVFYYEGKEMKPNRVWFGCQITGKTMGGEAYVHYDNALRRVYLKIGERFEPYLRQPFRNVACDCKDGYLYNFRRE